MSTCQKKNSEQKESHVKKEQPKIKSVNVMLNHEMLM